MFGRTDVTAGQDVKDLFAEFLSGDKYGVIQIILQGDELRVGSFMEFTQSCDQDLESAVLPLLEDDVNCYILYRLGFPSNRDYQWVYLSWFPKNSPMREKMLGATLNDKVKQEFGRGFIFEFSAETKDEVVSGFGSFLAYWQKRH